MKPDNYFLKDWIPYRLIFQDGIPLVQWLYVSDVSFDHPFFEETIAHCRSHHHNSSRFKSVSSLESMVEWAGLLSVSVPVTFIFHISRCGSTLLSQLIGLNKKNTVLSEVPFFDEILRLSYKVTIDDEFKKRTLLAAIKLTGTNRSVKTEQLFVKTDSWHISYYQIFRDLYPSAPFVLLYRSPDEVIRSHQKNRGMHAVQNVIEPEVFGFTSEEINDLSMDEYTAKVLEKYMFLFAEVISKDEKSLLLNYEKGPEEMMERIYTHLNIYLEEEYLLEIQNRSRFHSKYPKQVFSEAVLKENVPAYMEVAMNAYHQLENLRKNKTE